LAAKHRATLQEQRAMTYVHWAFMAKYFWKDNKKSTNYGVQLSTIYL
jgi:hypothetical protein